MTVNCIMMFQIILRKVVSNDLSICLFPCSVWNQSFGANQLKRDPLYHLQTTHLPLVIRFCYVNLDVQFPFHLLATTIHLADNEGDWQAWSLARLCFPPVDTHETQILARRRGIDSKNQPEKGCTQGTRWFSPSTSFVLSSFLYFSVYDWSEEKLHIVVLLYSLTHTHSAHPGRAVHHDPLTFAHACYTCAKHANSAQHRSCTHATCPALFVTVLHKWKPQAKL